MSERWMPEEGEIYYFVNSTCDVSDCEWLDDSEDRLHYKNGNCFSSEEKAQATAKKVKDLLLGLHDEKSEQLPTLTTDIFRHPECPEWARYAYVGGLGIPVVCENMPEKVSDGHYRNSESGRWDIFKMTGRFSYFDNNNEHYYIKRPVELPDWYKFGVVGWHKRAGYFTAGAKDELARRISIQRIGDKSIGWLSYETLCTEVKQARPRHYTEDEMKALVGKPITMPDGSVCLCTAYSKQCKSVVLDNTHCNAQKLLDGGYTIDGQPCGVLEHLNEKGEWVE